MDSFTKRFHQGLPLITEIGMAYAAKGLGSFFDERFTVSRRFSSYIA